MHAKKLVTLQRPQPLYACIPLSGESSGVADWDDTYEEVSDPETGQPYHEKLSTESLKALGERKRAKRESRTEV